MENEIMGPLPSRRVLGYQTWSYPQNWRDASEHYELVEATDTRLRTLYAGAWDCNETCLMRAIEREQHIRSIWPHFSR